MRWYSGTPIEKSENTSSGLDERVQPIRLQSNKSGPMWFMELTPSAATPGQRRENAIQTLNRRWLPRLVGHRHFSSTLTHTDMTRLLLSNRIFRNSASSP